MNSSRFISIFKSSSAVNSCVPVPKYIIKVLRDVPDKGAIMRCNSTLPVPQCKKGTCDITDSVSVPVHFTCTDNCSEVNGVLKCKKGKKTILTGEVEMHADCVVKSGTP